MQPLEFELTREDCRHAVEAHHRSRSGSWPVRVISLAMMILGMLRLLDGDYAWGTVFFAVGMSYPILSARLASYAIVRRESPELGTVRLEFDERGLHVDGPGYTGTIAHLDRVAVAPRSILLYADPSHYVVVPRRVFPDRDAFQEFVGHARRLVDAPIDVSSEPG